jgi:hypothetical protein
MAVGHRVNEKDFPAQTVNRPRLRRKSVIGRVDNFSQCVGSDNSFVGYLGFVDIVEHLPGAKVVSVPISVQVFKKDILPIVIDGLFCFH